MKSIEERFKVVPAVYVILRDGDKVLLLKRANTGYHDGDYSLPAGHVDGGEPAPQAAVREAKKEVGLITAPENLRLVHTMHRNSAVPTPHERFDLFFEATKWRGKPRNLEPHKCDELTWAALSDLPANMVPEVHQALMLIAKGQIYSNFGF